MLGYITGVVPAREQGNTILGIKYGSGNFEKAN